MMRRVWVVLVSAVLALMIAIPSGCSSSKKSKELSVPSGGKKEVVPSKEGKGEETGAIPRPPRADGTKGLAPSDLNTKMAKIYFDFDKSNVREDQVAGLEGDAEYLKKNKDFNLVIEGHCDERGTLEYNLALGQRRASSVREFLISRGVDGSRLSVVSFGEEKPADPRHNEEGWALNRRAEFSAP